MTSWSSNNDVIKLSKDVCDCKLSEKGALMYQIKWLGYPASENTWERASNLDPEGTLFTDTCFSLAGLWETRNMKVKAPKLFAVARCLFYWTLPWWMKYSKFWFQNGQFLLETLNIKFRGASLMRNLRKCASHITGMTIRSMRSVLKFFFATKSVFLWPCVGCNARFSMARTLSKIQNRKKNINEFWIQWNTWKSSFAASLQLLGKLPPCKNYKFGMVRIVFQHAWHKLTTSKVDGHGWWFIVSKITAKIIFEYFLAV